MFQPIITRSFLYGTTLPNNPGPLAFLQSRAIVRSASWAEMNSIIPIPILKVVNISRSSMEPSLWMMLKMGGISNDDFSISTPAPSGKYARNIFIKAAAGDMDQALDLDP